MTRARAPLQLFRITGVTNPHAEVLSGECVVQRKLRPVCDPEERIVRHALLGMEDLYLDFAGVKRENHPVRSALARLNAGDALHFAVVNTNLELQNADHISVARLASRAQQKWRPLLDRVDGARVVAMVRRHRFTGEEKYQKRYHGDTWTVPLIELQYR